ncbi:unnamed protein product [Miscanthus lutarioriparius]|uniref:Uncharacterized protein n=1 Tax=Miscanthus lutarioriparius TaxID=422564 RepID=A0A811SAJ7_9POAL|nr:unnamed protein product [Miscanthus lutarioriparius]
MRVKKVDVEDVALISCRADRLLLQEDGGCRMWQACAVETQFEEAVCGGMRDLDEGGGTMSMWVWDLYGRGELLDAADPRLDDGGGGFQPLEMERVLGVGLWCVHPDYASRASIRQAMSVLQFEAPLPELPLEMPVATYGPPVARGYYWSTTTTSSSAGAKTGGHSSTSE